MRKFIDYIVIALKGAAMGAADVVPGVSGGTIAFISGIYEELIGTIKSFDAKALRLLLTFRFTEFWRKVNGNFLASLLVGIAFSIFTLAKLMTYLLEHYPVMTWAFFFGLITASIIMIAREIPRWNIARIAALICGAAAIVLLSVATPASTPETWWFVMISGAIAICAMILPGISGAFILLLLGKYQYMMQAVADYDFFTIFVFAVGAVAGIIAFSHFLSWLLGNFRAGTMAVLTGVLLGSLYKIWPWKEVLETYADSHGNIHPLVERNVLPGTYADLYGSGAHLWEAVLLAVAGLALILLIERTGRRIGEKRAAGKV